MRFCGEVGYGESTETAPGVWENVITERQYRGDVNRSIKREQEGENLHDDLKMNNAISVLADEYAYNHFFAIKYVVWQGQRWKVSAAEVKPPRLILNIGGLYHGPTP